MEWEAASSLIEGICLTLQRQPIISFLPHLRSLINVCVNLVWGAEFLEWGGGSDLFRSMLCFFFYKYISFEEGITKYVFLLFSHLILIELNEKR